MGATDAEMHDWMNTEMDGQWMEERTDKWTEGWVGRCRTHGQMQAHTQVEA